MAKYAMYKGKKLFASVEKNIVTLRTKHKLDGFELCIEENGFEIIKWYKKQVTISEVDIVFEEIPYIKYLGEYHNFLCSPQAYDFIKDDSIKIYTSSSELALNDGYERIDKFGWCKIVKIDDIEEIVLRRKAVGPFKGQDCTDVIIKRDKVREYIFELKREYEDE